MIYAVNYGMLSVHLSVVPCALAALAAWRLAFKIHSHTYLFVFLATLATSYAISYFLTSIGVIPSPAQWSYLMRWFGIFVWGSLAATLVVLVNIVLRMIAVVNEARSTQRFLEIENEGLKKKLGE